MKDLSIIVPIFNEEDNLLILQQRLEKVAADITEYYEIIYVNDGSKDKSIQIIKTLSETNSKVKYLSFSRNFGHQIAISAGIDVAEGNAVVLIDGDLQDPPELIAPMYQKLKEGFKVVYAKRNKRKNERIFKTFTAHMFYRLLKSITQINIPVDTGDFRIMDRIVVDKLKAMPEQNKFLRGQIPWLGFSETAVSYDRDERLHGETKFTLKKMFNLALDGITSFSDFPLKMATILGVFTSFISFSIILYALFSHFVLEKTITGWTSMMVSTMFIGGIQLLSLGIIGEYISRINQNIRNRPLYIVEETNINK